MFYIVKFKDPIFINYVKNKEEFKGEIESIHQLLKFLKKGIEIISKEEEKNEAIKLVHEYEKNIDHYIQINVSEENKELKLFLELLLKANIIDNYF